MSVALPLPRGRAGTVAQRTAAARLADGLLFATLLTVTFTAVRWTVGTVDLTLSDLTASLFVVAFLLARIEQRDTSFPRTVAVVGGFFLAFLLVYLVGYFNLETAADRDQFVKGVVKFVIHFAFLGTAVAYLGRRSTRFYWRSLGWLTAGLALSAAYALVELAVAETSGGNLDRALLSPIGSYQRGGISVFGVVEGSSVYRPDALTLDPNHLGVMLIVPICILLPVYLRLERGHPFRTRLALLLGLFALAELATLSRSGLLGLAVGLIVLAIPYRRLLFSSRVLLPLAVVALVVGIVVAQRTSVFESVVRARTSLEGSSTRAHLEVYDLVPPLIDKNPLLGRGLNTFANYYEEITGKTNWGPHSYYIAVLTETGVIGAMLFLCYLAYLIHRLGVLHRVGRALAAAGGEEAGLVHALAWGLAAALAGTLAANAFYLTMHMYYFFVFAVFVLAAPIVFSRSRARPPAAPARRAST